MIIGTPTVVYTAWEPSELVGRHSTVTTYAGEWYGCIGTDPEKSLYDHVPVGEDRSMAVRDAYEQRYEVAYDAIIKAFPEAAGGRRSGGEITVRDYSGMADTRTCQITKGATR